MSLYLHGCTDAPLILPMSSSTRFSCSSTNSCWSRCCLGLYSIIDEALSSLSHSFLFFDIAAAHDGRGMEFRQALQAYLSHSRIPSVIVLRILAVEWYELSAQKLGYAIEHYEPASYRRNLRWLSRVHNCASILAIVTTALVYRQYILCQKIGPLRLIWYNFTNLHLFNKSFPP